MSYKKDDDHSMEMFDDHSTGIINDESSTDDDRIPKSAVKFHDHDESSMDNNLNVRFENDSTGSSRHEDSNEEMAPMFERNEQPEGGGGIKRRRNPRKDRQNMALSVVSRLYDRDGKGYLSKGEARARALDTDGTGKVSGHILSEQLDSNLRAQKRYGIAFGLLLATIVGLSVTLIVVLSDSTKSINQSVADTVTTMVSDVDQYGDSLLLSADGSTIITTQAMGHSYDAQFVYDSVTKNTVVCLPIIDAAMIMHDIRIGSDARIVIGDSEYGRERILDVAKGDAEDHGDYLSLSDNKISLRFDSATCNEDGGTTGTVDMNNGDVNAYTEENGGSSAEDNIFDPLYRRELIAGQRRLRKQYDDARAALKKGQSYRLLKGGNGKGQGGNGQGQVAVVMINNENTSTDNSGIAGNSQITLKPSEVRKFSDILNDEIQQCMKCPFNETLKQALFEFEVNDEGTGNALLNALADESIDVFDNTKIAVIENRGFLGFAGCHAGSNDSLCKNNKKKDDAMNKVFEKFNSKIEEAEEAEVEPDVDEIFSQLEIENGLSPIMVEWLFNEDPTETERIKSRLKEAKKKAKGKEMKEKGDSVEEILTVFLDQGDDIETAVSKSGFDVYDIDEAFSALNETRKEVLNEKIGKGRKEMKEKVEKVYSNRGYKKNGNNKKWDAPDDDNVGRFYFDTEGKMHFKQPNGHESFQSKAEKIRKKTENDSSRRKLEIQSIIKDTRDFNETLTLHVAKVQRHLLSLSDLGPNACPTRYMGCFLDSTSDADFVTSLGSAYSIEQCLNECHSKGFDYVGLQAGGQCFCGDEYFGKHGQSDSCNMLCSNGGGECGGSQSNSIYKHLEYPSAACISQSFETVGLELGVIASQVSEKLSPLSVLLEVVETSAVTLRTLKTTAQVTDLAVDIGSYIPYIGPLLKVAKTPVEFAKDSITKASDKTARFQNNIGKVWQNSVGRVLEILDSFSTTFIGPLLGVAGTISVVEDNQCAESIISGFLGDFLGIAESAMNSIQDYSHTLLNSLKDLLDVLTSSFWQTVESGLNTIMGGITPMIDFFKPLEGLGALLETEITIPWFQLPYLEQKLGDGRCNNGYYKGTSSPKICWEEESDDWEEQFSLYSPYKMMRTCASGDYQPRLLGGCWNEYDWSQTTGFHWSWWGPYCPSNYFVAPWRAWECTKNCPSGWHMDTGYCYRTSCSSGFWPEATIRCNGNTRNQYYHTAKCDHVSVNDPDATKYLSFFGECWQGCSAGDSSFLGLCFPPASLKISIQDVANAFAAIFEFIENLPIISWIKSAIDSIIGAILKPITDYISTLLPVDLPSFPDLSLDALPLGIFDNMAINLPALPDLSQFENLPEEVMKSLPIPDDIGLADCGLDVQCVLEKGGLDELLDKFGDIEEFISYFNMDNLMETFSNIVLDARCTEWEDLTLPVSSLLSKVPALGAVSACDIDIPVCKSFDFSGATEFISELTEMIEDIFSSQRLRGRALFLNPFLTSIAGILTSIFTIELSGGISRQFWGNNRGFQFEGGVKFLRTWTVDDKGPTEEGRIKAVSVGINVGPRFTLSPYLDFIKMKFGFSLAVAFDVTLSTNRGFRSILDETIMYAKTIEPLKKTDVSSKEDDRISQFAKDIGLGDSCLKFDSSSSEPIWNFTSIYENKKSCALQYQAVSVANNEWIVPRSALPEVIEENLDPSQGRLKVGRTDGKACSVDSMKQLDLETKYKEAWDCIQYWHKVKTDLDDYSQKVHSLLGSGSDWPCSAGCSTYDESTKQFFAAAFSRNVKKASISFGPFLKEYVLNNLGLSFANFTSVRFSFGITASHPINGTSLGPSFTFNDQMQLASFDFGSAELRHLYYLKSALAEIRNWTISVAASVQFKHTSMFN